VSCRSCEQRPGRPAWPFSFLGGARPTFRLIPDHPAVDQLDTHLPRHARCLYGQGEWLSLGERLDGGVGDGGVIEEDIEFERPVGASDDLPGDTDLAGVGVGLDILEEIG
jgi:hypothetical protein